MAYDKLPAPESGQPSENGKKRQTSKKDESERNHGMASVPETFCAEMQYWRICSLYQHTEYVVTAKCSDMFAYVDAEN